MSDNNQGWEFLRSGTEDINCSDGSWGTCDSDGNKSYYGADGSWGSRSSDGSGSYYGADGSWGSFCSDGSGSFYGADGHDTYYSSTGNADDVLSTGKSSSSKLSLSEIAAVALVTIGIGAIASGKAREREEREEASSTPWYVTPILLIILFGAWFGYYKYSEFQKSIPVGISSAELIENEYSYVEETLKSLGFTNIETNPVYDLEYSSIDREGIVTKVTIKGNSSFDSSSKYPYDTRIIITYHLLRELSVPMSPKAARKLDYLDVQTQFQDAGFVNVRTEPEYDLVTGWIKKDGSIEAITVDGNPDFSESDTYRPDVEIIIIYHTYKNNKPG